MKHLKPLLVVCNHRGALTSDGPLSPCKDQLLDLHVLSVSLETGSETQYFHKWWPTVYTQFGAYVSFFFFFNYYLKWFSNSFTDFSEVLELRRQVWKFWPKHVGYNQVTSIHSQTGSIKSSLQCNSSCYLCPTGLKSTLVSCLLVGCFLQCSSQSKEEKKLTELYRNITFFPWSGGKTNRSLK